MTTKVALHIHLTYTRTYNIYTRLPLGNMVDLKSSLVSQAEKGETTQEAFVRRTKNIQVKTK